MLTQLLCDKNPNKSPLRLTHYQCDNDLKIYLSQKMRRREGRMAMLYFSVIWMMEYDMESSGATKWEENGLIC